MPGRKGRSAQKRLVPAFRQPTALRPVQYPTVETTTALNNSLAEIAKGAQFLVEEAAAPRRPHKAKRPCPVLGIGGTSGT
eukprot:4055791-Alexandrium_andersonii.AAC.1